MNSAQSPARRVIHVIWIGSAPTPAVQASLAALARLNPDAEVRLWRDDDLDWLTNRALFDVAPSYPAKSNIARYEIIHRHGGVYVDADFEWRAPLDRRVIPDDRLVVAPVRESLLSNGLFAAPAGHPFLAQLIRNLGPSIAAAPDAASQVVSGPEFFTREFLAWRGASDATYAEVPRDLLYPYAVDKLERDLGPWSPQVIGIHHWSQGRSRRATNHLREAALDAGRRTGLRRARRFTRRALTPAGTGDAAVVDPSVTRFLLRVLEGSDVYVELGRAGYAAAAAPMLSSAGRVYTLDPTIEPGTSPVRVPSPGPAEAYLGAPATLGAQLDQLSHVRVVHLAAARPEDFLEHASHLVESGRVDFVVIPRGALDHPQVRTWCGAGATTGGIGPTGGLRRILPATAWCVVDARPIRARHIARPGAGGSPWRLPQAYRAVNKSTRHDGVACPACGGPTVGEPQYAGFDMIRCPRCTYLGTRDRSCTAAAYDEVYQDNHAYVQRFAHARTTAAAAEPWSQLDRFKRKALAWLDDECAVRRAEPDRAGGALLDVGCGPGAFLLGAKGLGWTVTGVEPAPAAAAVASELGLDVHPGTLGDASGPAGPFDAVTAFEVLEHVGNPVELLRAMRGVLAPQGRIVMSMPNLDDANLLAQANPEDVPPIHVSFFNRRSLAAAAERAELRVERVYTHPIPVASLRNIHGAGWKYRLPREGVRAVVGRTDGSPMLVMLRHA